MADMWTINHLALENKKRRERNVAVLERADMLEAMFIFRR